MTISVVYLEKATLLEAGGVVITSSLWEQPHCFKGVLCKCDKPREFIIEEYLYIQSILA